VDIDLNAATTVYTTYEMRTLKVVDSRILPRLITGVNGWVIRRDLTERDLTTQECSELNQHTAIATDKLLCQQTAK
jgi:hypothetical protein